MSRLDSAARSFAWLVLAAALLGASIGLVACCIVAFLGGYAVHRGLTATLTDSTLRPAVLLIALAGAGAGAGAISGALQLVRTRRLKSWTVRHAQISPPRLAAGSRRVGLPHVRLLDIAAPTAFTVGLLTPVVVLSRGLLNQVDDDELEAVLEHEKYHVRHRDPLRMFVARVLTQLHFYVPALATLRDRYLVGRELAADRGSLRNHGRTPLVGALLKVVDGPDLVLSGAIATLAGRETLEARIAQLESGREPPLVRPGRNRVLLSVMGGSAFAWALALSALTFGGLPGVMGRLCGCGT